MELAASLIGILAVLFVGVISPGPSFLLVAQTAVSQSRRAALLSALGMALGATLLCILALLGLQALLLQFPWAHMALRIVGAVYLLYLAVQLWRKSGTPVVAAEGAGVRRSGWRHFAMAFGVMITNPKAAVQYGVIFGTFLPQHPTLALSLLLPVCVFCMEAGWYAFVAFVLSSQRPRNSYLRAKRSIDRVASLLLGGMSIRLLVTR